MSHFCEDECSAFSKCMLEAVHLVLHVLKALTAVVRTICHKFMVMSDALPPAQCMLEAVHLNLQVLTALIALGRS